MNDIAIKVENLSKRYRIGAQQESYKTLRDMVSNAASAPLRWARAGRQGAAQSERDFWALNDVSFEVKRGEVVGIIGRNGAGKSTLLKILSRITEPTSGTVDIYGRVGSLLEVGTGFHPELTGRENIYLNGAILGMKREEIARQFDAIVEFAEVEKFVDTAVKHYSSGMYLRLAFAVAAHLEPEILLVDEVLAVGDAQFQKKCLGKMGEVAKQGRTVFFVSHNMAAISHLCTAAFYLRAGTLALSGPTERIIEHYIAMTESERDVEGKTLASYRPSWARPLITSVKLLDSAGRERSTFPMGADITIEMTFNASDSTPLRKPVMGIVINHLVRGTVGGVNTRMTGFEIESKNYSYATIRCTIPHIPILQGQYNLDIWLGDGENDVDNLTGYTSFSIEETDIYKTGKLPFGHMGLVFFTPEWEISV